MFTFDYDAYREKTAWYRHDRFGMFIHWGLYSIPARGEWVMSEERMTAEEYRPYFDAFDPVDFDPAAWARAAKDAGMRYAVLTTKHHDGFCLFDSALTDYKSTNTRAGRDLVREFVDAFRAEGLKVGLYVSLIDWHHPDFPAYGDRQHPMRDNEAYKDYPHDFDRYLAYLHGQVKELCTNYGRIDLFWFDFSYDHLRGEAWRASELVRMVRAYQPHAIMDNRLEVSGEGMGSLVTETPSEFCGDFVSPEQIIPPAGIRDAFGRPVCWEACVTMNNHWCYCQNDRFYKPAPMLIRKLVECVSKGGNLLLNVGPDARGSIPSESLAILREIGAWMRKNGESNYGCDASETEKPEFGRITQRGNTMYYHVLDAPIGYIPLTGLRREEIARIWLPATGAEVCTKSDWITNNYPDTVFVSLGDDPVPPDTTDTVIAVTRKETYE